MHSAVRSARAPVPTWVGSLAFAIVAPWGLLARPARHMGAFVRRAASASYRRRWKADKAQTHPARRRHYEECRASASSASSRRWDEARPDVPSSGRQSKRAILRAVHSVRQHSATASVRQSARDGRRDDLSRIGETRTR
jgi:hypothetical protein